MIVFTEHSLRPFLDAGASLPRDGISATLLGRDTVAMTSGGHLVVSHRSDTRDARLIVMSSSAMDSVAELGGQAVARLLERVDRAAREFWNPPVSLPTAWHKYQWENRLAFFALPPGINASAWRWIAERRSNSDVVFWKLASRDDEESLEAFDADEDAAADARRAWAGSLDDMLAALPADSGPQVLQPAVDLDVIGRQAMSRSQSYATWCSGDSLTEEQSQVLEFSGSHALKVRGPAGTGKTLVLQLKALHDLYQALDRGDTDYRVLYLTHSWALTELVDASLKAMDERGVASSSLDVMPVTWLRELLYGPLPEGVELLGDDSVEGKRRQLSLITAVIDTLREGDWQTFRGSVSDRIVAAVEATDSDDRVRLCWDLMRELPRSSTHTN